MKKLRLALLICLTATAALSKPPAVSADCVHLRVYYYPAPGVPSCGFSYIYCNADPFHTGCETQYYNVYGGCSCP